MTPKQPTPKQAYAAAKRAERAAYQSMRANWTAANKAAYRAAVAATQESYWAAYPKTPPATGQKVNA
jgi:hypothetical protein